MPDPETESLLRERIDDLSTRLLIDEPGPEASDGGPETFLAALAELGRQAGDAGYGEAARIAGALSASFEAAPAEAPGVAQLQAGLVRLQQALAHAGSDPETEHLRPERPRASFSLAQEPALVANFILESREHLTSTEQLILTLEREPANADAIHSVFRGFHTIKGLAGFLEFSPIQEVAHEVETALNLAREGKLAITAAVIDVILESVDYLSRAIASVESGGACERNPGHDRLLGKVRALMAAEPGAPMPAAPPETATPPEGGAKRPAAAAESSSVRVDTAKDRRKNN